MAWQLEFTSRRAHPLFEFLDAPKPLSPLFEISISTPVDASRLPTQARLRFAWSKPIPDIFPTPGLNAVSQRFRDLVETFEPGAHQFFPLKLFALDGSSIEGNYYIFNCAAGIDAIIHTVSDAKWTTDATGRPLLYAGMRKEFEISRQAIGDHHLWCGKTVATRELFCSDAFYEAIKRNKITGLDAVHRKELDVPWVAEKELAPFLKWKANRQSSAI